MTGKNVFLENATSFRNILYVSLLQHHSTCELQFTVHYAAYTETQLRANVCIFYYFPQNSVSSHPDVNTECRVLVWTGMYLHLHHWHMSESGNAKMIILSQISTELNWKCNQDLPIYSHHLFKECSPCQTSIYPWNFSLLEFLLMCTMK